MNALDTNILVRFFIKNPYNDEDCQQHLIATEILKTDCFISLTVILELVWVLKSRYQLNRENISNALSVLCELGNVIIEKQYAVEHALSYYNNGMDFADALHLLQSTHCQYFYTFDQKFIKKSKKLHFDNTVVEPTL